jgi:hypothetical protein
LHKSVPSLNNLLNWGQGTHNTLCMCYFYFIFLTCKIFLSLFCHKSVLWFK